VWCAAVAGSLLPQHPQSFSARPPSPTPPAAPRTASLPGDTSPPAPLDSAAPASVSCSPVGIEVLFAQRHRHVLQASVISRTHRFDIRAFLFRRGIGPLRRVAVELGRSDNHQSSEANSCRKRAMIGTSALQSPHQCAQKNSRTGEPFSDARLGGFGPRYCVTCKGGADWPTNASRLSSFAAADESKYSRSGPLQNAADSPPGRAFLAHPFLRQNFVSCAQRERQMRFGIQFALGELLLRKTSCLRRITRCWSHCPRFAAPRAIHDSASRYSGVTHAALCKYAARSRLRQKSSVLTGRGHRQSRQLG